MYLANLSEILGKDTRTQDEMTEMGTRGSRKDSYCEAKGGSAKLGTSRARIPGRWHVGITRSASGHLLAGQTLHLRRTTSPPQPLPSPPLSCSPPDSNNSLRDSPSRLNPKAWRRGTPLLRQLTGAPLQKGALMSSPKD